MQIKVKKSKLRRAYGDLKTISQDLLGQKYTKFEKITQVELRKISSDFLQRMFEDAKEENAMLLCYRCSIRAMSARLANIGSPIYSRTLLFMSEWLSINPHL